MVRYFARAALCLGLLLLSSGAVAATGQVQDMTWLCELSARSNSANLYLATDGSQSTVWRSSDTEDQHLQIRKPEGAATLSVLWANVAPGVRLQQLIDGQWTTIQDFSESATMPETIELPKEICDLRLRARGQMVIAELYVHSGYMPTLFTRQGATPVPMTYQATPTPAPSITPLARGMTGRRVKKLQERLAELGYFHASSTGVFAQNTFASVCSFQRAVGLEPTGIVDDATQAMLDNANAPAATPRPPGYNPDKLFQRKASQMITFMRTRIGLGYIYGGSGEVCSRDVRLARAGQYPEFAELLRGIAAKWDGLEVYDCNGLFKAFLDRSEGEYPDSWHTNVTGAALRWSVELGPIETMPKQPGIMLLQKRDPGSGYMHTGVYIGNGIFVHARGHTYGVMAEQMPQVWTHWVRLSWLEYDLPEETGDVPWDGGLSVGDYAMIDTPAGVPTVLRVTPDEKSLQLSSVIDNKTKVMITEVPEGKNYWRMISGIDRKGKQVSGYVYAKDLTSLEPLPPMPLWPAQILEQLTAADAAKAKAAAPTPTPQAPMEASADQAVNN